MNPDPHPLERFVKAQDAVWESVQAELRDGRKVSHWMWFVFPQLAQLGSSSTAKFYGIRGTEEAKAYLSHPVLGPRLVQSCQQLLAVRGRTAVQIFGSVDAMKLRSSLTLFAAIAPQENVVRQCLQQFFRGSPDELTLRLLER